MDDLAYSPTLIPADYYGADPTTVRDAVRAFSDDLLAPLLNELKPPESTSNISPSTILDALTQKSLPAIQQYFACIRRALIGPRGPKAFQEAAHLWHRRAAAVAALRNENQADRPGWPPLCPTWNSPCGHYRIVPLTTAKALVGDLAAAEHYTEMLLDHSTRHALARLWSLLSGNPRKPPWFWRGPLGPCSVKIFDCTRT
jgi:hypothetical protein